MPAPEVMRAEVLNATCHEYDIHHKQLMAYAYCLKVWAGEHRTLLSAGHYHAQTNTQPLPSPQALPLQPPHLAGQGRSMATTASPPLAHALSAPAYWVQDHGANHRWMGFIDADEFVVLTDGTPDLPTLLRDYEDHGALALNWRMFGSSAWKAGVRVAPAGAAVPAVAAAPTPQSGLASATTRPPRPGRRVPLQADAGTQPYIAGCAADGHATRQNNTLLSYTKCNAQDVRVAACGLCPTPCWAALPPGSHSWPAPCLLVAAPIWPLILLLPSGSPG